MKSITGTTLAEQVKKTGASPTWVMKCYFNTGTIYLAEDARTNLSATMYRVKSWGSINEDISGDISMPRVADFELEAIVDPGQTTNIYDIVSSRVNSVETATCELYLYFVTDGVLPDPIPIGTFNILDYEMVDELTCRIQFIDESVSKNKYIGNQLNSVTYPKIDPVAVGRVGNVIYGTVTNAPCLCIDAGGASILTADITAASPGNSGTLVLADASRFPSGSPFIIQIQSEQISIASRSGNTLTLVGSGARGYGSTTAAAHAAGSAAWELKSEYSFLLADHPINSIGNVYIGKDACTSGYIKYTGQSGNEHPSYPGKAVITLQHGIGVVTHDLPNSTSGTYGWAKAGGSPNSAIDGNEATWAGTEYGGEYLNIVFPAPAAGVISYQSVYVKMTHNNSVSNLSILGGWAPSLLGNTGSTLYWSFTKSGPVSSNYIEFLTAGGISFAFVYEVLYRETGYYELNSGSTAAEIWIGKDISADCTGYRDNANGDFTGIPAGLIERPDHVLKHLLYTYAGVVTANFVTDAGTEFTARSYAASLVINEYKTVRDWMTRLSFEWRCYSRFALGKAYLLWRPDTMLADKTITSNMIKMKSNGTSSMNIKRSLLGEIINKIDVKYGRNPTDNSYSGAYSVSDSYSAQRYGTKERPDLFELTSVATAAMAQSVAQFYLETYKERRKVATFECFLDNAELEFADVLILEPISTRFYEIAAVNYAPGSHQSNRIDTISITAVEKIGPWAAHVACGIPTLYIIGKKGSSKSVHIKTGMKIDTDKMWIHRTRMHLKTGTKAEAAGRKGGKITIQFKFGTRVTLTGVH